ncbi:OmpA family protein [Propioniciclava sinopodophylli]|uniref:OmpA family protein n=2 Tax=Propioniciclava sinopodophylli TaxID=1837344 RepID=A0A4Q9KID5_9ACTN|nr:OmpA family protein [Propioniciclava sinopodophylli]
MTFSVPVGPADAAPPKPEATLGEVETEQAAPELRVTPAPAAPTPEGTASPTPEPVRVGVSDIKPLPVSTSTRLANPGSWLVREGATPPPAEDPNAEAKAQQSLKDLGAQRTPDGWVLTLPETVLFEYNKYDILPGADAKLTEVGALLAHFADAEIRVQGHTDSTGSADGNATLSKNRADAVAKALSGKGVSASRMTVEGFAAERPVASNATDEGRAKNRRVEIVLREKA